VAVTIIAAAVTIIAAAIATRIIRVNRSMEPLLFAYSTSSWPGR
jgi:hypothetical protein